MNIKSPSDWAVNSLNQFIKQERMKVVLRHILHFIVGASLAAVLMFVTHWDMSNVATHSKLFVYGICMTGMFAAVCLHEDKSKDNSLLRKCERLEIEQEETLAEVRLCRRNLLSDVHSLDRMVLDRFLAQRLREGFADETYYKKADREVLLAYIDLLTGQLRKHTIPQTEEEIIKEQLEFRRQHPIKG